MARDYIDFGRIEAHQHEIHARLTNWSLWVRVHPGTGWAVSPIFRLAMSNARQWHQPEFRPTCDILDAQHIEHLVATLPEQHRTAVRWWYVYGGGPGKACRVLGVNRRTLDMLVRHGRQLLIGMTEPPRQDLGKTPAVKNLQGI